MQLYSFFLITYSHEVNFFLGEMEMGNPAVASIAASRTEAGNASRLHGLHWRNVLIPRLSKTKKASESEPFLFCDNA